MAAAPLPPALEARLGDLAARLRRLRVARGASRVALVATAGAVLLILFDTAFAPPVLFRSLFQLLWVLAVGVVAVRHVVAPWRAEVPLAEAARHVEARFPVLGERLITAVTLRDAADPANGSPHLIAGLARETERHALGLNFAEAAPARPAVRAVALAALVLLTAVAVATVVPGSGQRLRRVALPWHRPAVALSYRVFVSSGSPVVRRGDPVTLAAYVERTDPSASLPEAATLVFRDGPVSAAERLAMTGDGSAAFHATRPGVTADFEYRVEIGPAVSEWHTVLVADPVELTDATTTEIIPPGYAASAIKSRTLPGLADLDGLPHSTALIRFGFNRSASVALVEWRADGKSDAAPDLIPAQLAPDGRSGVVTLRLPQSGTFRVVLMNEPGPRRMRTEVVVPVRVTPDNAPRFESVSGVTTRPRAVRPGGQIRVAFTATDDVTISAAELEYVVGPDEKDVKRIRIDPRGTDPRRAEARFVFDLAGKGGEGDTVRFRVRVRDNQTLADARLAPQEAVYPPSGWSELVLSGSAPPLPQAEIVAERDAVRDAFLGALEEVKAAIAEAEGLRADTAGKTALALDHTVRLDATRTRVRKAMAVLAWVAGDVGLGAEIRVLAVALRESAGRELRDATDAMRKAGTDQPGERSAALVAAGRFLTAAAARIEDHVARNGRLAQDRLDRVLLNDLAANQKNLAERVTTPEKADELLKAQRDLLDRLAKLVAGSEPMKRGTEAAAGREARRLADELAALAGLVRELDAATNRFTADARRVVLDEILKAQAVLADRAAALLARIETPARLAGLIPPRADDFRKVAGLIAAGDTVDALVELEKLAAGLDRVAGAFETRAADRADAKLAATQLVAWQDDLRTRLIAATRAKPFDQLPDADRAAFRLEQRAIREATERLRVPPAKEPADARAVALAAVGQAVAALDADGRAADATMKAAARALTRLAEKTPANVRRLADSRPEFDRIRIEQDSITVAAEAVLKPAERQVPDPAAVKALAGKLEPTHTRQLALIPRLVALDLPGLEARQARTVVALTAAAADLRDGSPFDIAASQAWARRELDRLKLAADGITPPDDKADELARSQAGISAGVLALGANPTRVQLDPFVAVQADVLRQLEPLQVPEAVVLFQFALAAVRSAEAGFRDGSKADEVNRRVKVAADAVGKLAARVNGTETDLDRLKRLAGYRRQGEEDAKRLAGKGRNPEASREAARQLGWELDEFALTRVGFAGQPPKKRLVEAYTRLKSHPEPDRQAGDQKALADLLDELAAKTAEDAELVGNPPRAAVPDPVDPAEAFLPSKPLADLLRGLARDQRGVRDRVATAPAELVRVTRPGGSDPLAAVELKQRELAGSIAEFARSLATVKDAPAGAREAAADARRVADLLAIGEVGPAREAGELVARRLRELEAAAERPWAKPAGDLAAKQEGLLKELAPHGTDPAAVTSRQKARTEELARKAHDLAQSLDLAGRAAPPDDPGATALADAANLARLAERLLTDAVRKGAEVSPEGAAKRRAAAVAHLRKAGELAAGAGPKPAEPAGPEPDPASLAAGVAAKQAEAAMKQALAALEGDDRAAAERAMRLAADALARAAGATRGEPGR